MPQHFQKGQVNSEPYILLYMCGGREEAGAREGREGGRRGREGREKGREGREGEEGGKGGRRGSGGWEVRKGGTETPETTMGLFWSTFLSVLVCYCDCSISRTS